MVKVTFHMNWLVPYMLLLMLYGAVMFHATQKEHSDDEDDHDVNRGFDVKDGEKTSKLHKYDSSDFNWLKNPRDFYARLATPETKCRKLAELGGFHCKGYKDNGKKVCFDEDVRLHSRNCIVYSFGVGDDITFDDMASYYGCDVYMFDPSVDEIFVREHLKPRQHFYPYGLFGTNELIVYEGRKRGEAKKWALKTLDNIKLELGHQNTPVDYLKLDIEGSEWKSLPYLYSHNLLDGVKQVAIEIHTTDIIGAPPDQVLEKLQEFWRILEGLERRGFRRTFYSPNYVLSSIYNIPGGNSTETCAEILYIRRST